MRAPGVLVYALAFDRLGTLEYVRLGIAVN
jgi:hypothetical protein